MRAVRKTHLDPKDLPALDRVTLRRIAFCVRPYALRAAVVVACIAAGAILNLIPSWFAKRIVDVAIPAHDLTRLWIYCAAMIAGPVVAGLFQVGQKYGAESIGQSVMCDLRVALYRHLHAMPFAFFTAQRPGEAVSYVLNDVQGVGSAVSSTLVDLSQSLIVLTSTLTFLVWLDWRLALVAVAMLPLFVVPTRRVGRRRKALKRTVQARIGELTGMLTETLSISGALLVKVFGVEDFEVRRFQEKSSEIKRLSLEQTLTGRWFQMLLGLFESIGPALVFALGGWLVVAGRLPLGTVVAFVTVLKRLYNPASQLAGMHVDLMTSYAYFDRVFDVLDRVPEIADAPDAIAAVPRHGAIELRNVSFSYDAAAPSLSNIAISIPAGSKVGIVGPSGAGKSTLAALVLRLYDPTDGVVRIDGTDVRRLKLASLRQAIAIVTQDTFLMCASVLDNLRYANPAATRAEVEDAARQAHIHDVIAALPDGYDTIVGERGYRFSAGERQRIAIARAILKNPRILILDEATSSLDSMSEEHVLAGFAALRDRCTSLMIAHRLATVRDADVILVMDHGRIVERGTHDQLMRFDGLYAQMWHAQVREDHTRVARRGRLLAFAGRAPFVEHDLPAAAGFAAPD
jgi:ATP-binding cassette subfamily B protein